MCVCVCVGARVCCAWRGGWGGGGGRGFTCVQVHMFWQSITWVLQTQKYWVPNAFKRCLLTNDVHLEDFMHLIILVSQVTVTIRGLCCCVFCYVCDVCRLLLMLLSLSQWGFIVGGRIKGGWGPERQFAKVQPPGSRQPESSWENNKSNENMLVTYYATKYTRLCMNETSHPKSVHIYLHQTIPAIQSNNDIIPMGDPQHTMGSWLECQICDWKVAGSNPCRSSRRIFFSMVNFLCWLLFC